MNARRQCGKPVGTSKPLSRDLREQVLGCVGSVVSGWQAAERFGISAAGHQRTRELAQIDARKAQGDDRESVGIVDTAEHQRLPTCTKPFTTPALADSCRPTNVIRIWLVG